MKKTLNNRKQLGAIQKEIARKKMTVIILSTVIVASWVLIGVTALISVNRPAHAGLLLVNEPGTNNSPVAMSNLDGSSLSTFSSVPTSTPTSTLPLVSPCCGTVAGRTYSCADTSFNGTLCANGSPYLKRFPHFPLPGETVNWLCVCYDSVGQPLYDEYGERITASCSARNSCNTCFDSDGGLNSNVYGCTSGFYNGRTPGSYEYCDKCWNDKQVLERSCYRDQYGGGTSGDTIIDCPNGCLNGACN